MENKDYARVVTTQDLERKYDLGGLVKDRKAIELQKETLTKVETELNNFVESVSGDSVVWFYSGVPTLSNLPASEWTTTELKEEHVGDLYYDKDTGYVYKFNSSYEWEQVESNSIIEALAIANSAKDTADSKRRVFVSEPTTPYDIGDIWFNDGEMYRCSVARESGAFNSNDFIIATKYTDDAVALDTRAVLDAFQTQVENDYATTTQLNTTSESIIAQVEGVLSTKADGEVVDVLKTDVANLKLTSDTLNVQITSINTNGVNRVVTETGFVFDKDGLSISKIGEEMNSLVDNTGLYVKRDDEIILSANNTGVEAENIKVRKFLVIGDNFRVENYEGGLGFFFVGGDE